jgi:nucleotide-binding universal stress UspA family protein
VKVLGAIDVSQGALRAAGFVAKPAAGAKSLETNLMSVVVSSVGPFSEAGKLVPAVSPAQSEAEAATGLDAAEKMLKDAGVAVASKRTDWGPPAERVCAVAQETGADLVVVGSRGLGALTSLLVGNVSEQIVQRCHAPVLVVR